ncbi:MAG: hypothetical protein NW207_10120 [Cytophagales bacterium]|nr:hypothetical protein [Cytophagales bacterium]
MAQYIGIVKDLAYTNGMYTGEVLINTRVWDIETCMDMTQQISIPFAQHFIPSGFVKPEMNNDVRSNTDGEYVVLNIEHVEISVEPDVALYNCEGYIPYYKLCHLHIVPYYKEITSTGMNATQILRFAKPAEIQQYMQPVVSVHSRNMSLVA